MKHRAWAILGLAVGAASAFAQGPAPAEKGMPEAVMTAPFPAQRANFFHAALGVPRFETAELLPAGGVYLRARTECSHSEKGSPPGEGVVQEQVRNGRPESSCLGQFNTWLGLEVRGSPWDWLELGARLAYAGWDEHQDHFYFFDAAGAPLVRYEDRDIYGAGPSGRGDDISDAVLKVKARLYQSPGRAQTMSLAGQAKLPLGQPRNLVDAGTTDLGLGILSTTRVGPWAIHVNAAAVAPAGDQNLFVKSADVTLDPFCSGGLGVTFAWDRTLSFGLQAEGNTSAFSDVPFLDASPLTLLGGVRKVLGESVVEAGVGWGLDADESYGWSFFTAAGWML